MVLMRARRGISNGVRARGDGRNVASRRLAAVTEPPRDLAELVGPGWPEALAPVAGDIAAMGDFLRRELAAGRGFLPAGADVLRAFRTPLDSIRVLIVGQDPYPTPGHAMGLSFSVRPGVKPIPRSLANIFRELQSDLGINPSVNGDLSLWAERGVMLLNRVLTVSPGRPGSHAGQGWEPVTDAAIRALVTRDRPLVAVLWGRQAQQLQPLLGSTPTVCSAHPSPMSADRGFFGSRPFSRTNELLAGIGSEPVDWRL